MLQRTFISFYFVVLFYNRQDVFALVGLAVEGVYRRAGQNAVISQLLSEFNSGRYISM